MSEGSQIPINNLIASQKPVHVVAEDELNLLMADWFAEIERIANIVRECAEAQRRLKNKRATLEEKMIGKYLNEMASIYGSLVHLVHSAMLSVQTEESNKISSEISSEISCEDRSEMRSEIQDKMPGVCFDLSVETLAHLREIDLDVEPVIADFLQKICYDLNYLEQYYEHDFLARLLDKHMFVPRLQGLLSAICS